MGQRHALASADSWVELRDPSELRAGDQMDIQDAMDAEQGGRAARQMYNAIIAVLTVNWSLALPVPNPKSTESIRLMEIRDYEALKKLVDPAVEVVFPGNPEPETPEDLAEAKEDAGSPTGDADAS